MLEALISSKTRVKLLTLFLLNPERDYFVREITRMTGENINAVRRELANLESFGLITGRKRGNQQHYAVNTGHFLYADLQKIVLKTSRAIVTTDHDGAYTIAYNAVLQAGRALMFAKGYRPDGANQHISVVKFAGLFLEKNDALIFDRMRRKRHGSVYDMAGSISGAEAESAVDYAEVLIRRIEEILNGNP